MVSAVDEGIGNITRKLQEKGMLADAVVIVTTDNGGPIVDCAGIGASNLPLRGGKCSLWEGGYVERSFTWQGLMHGADWLPTLVEGDLGHQAFRWHERLATADWRLGLCWRFRTPLYYGLADSQVGHHGPALREGPWKLIVGTGGGSGDHPHWWRSTGRAKTCAPSDQFKPPRLGEVRWKIPPSAVRSQTRRSECVPCSRRSMATRPPRCHNARVIRAVRPSRPCGHRKVHTWGLGVMTLNKKLSSRPLPPGSAGPAEAADPTTCGRSGKGALRSSEPPTRPKCVHHAQKRAISPAGNEEHSPSLLVVNVSIMTVYCALLLTLLWLRRAPPDTEGLARPPGSAEGPKTRSSAFEWGADSERLLWSVEKVEELDVDPQRVLRELKPGATQSDLLDALGTALGSSSQQPEVKKAAELLWQRCGWEPHARERHDYSLLHAIPNTSPTTHDWQVTRAPPAPEEAKQRPPSGSRHEPLLLGGSCPIIDAKGGFSSEVKSQLAEFLNPRAPRPCIIKNLPIFDRAVEKWSVDYLKEHMGDQLYHTFASTQEDRRFAYSFDCRNEGGYRPARIAEACKMTFKDFVKQQQCEDGKAYYLQTPVLRYEDGIVTSAKFDEQLEADLHTMNRRLVNEPWQR
eukprot:g17191.t1